MPVHNSDVAQILESVADLLEIEGANPFRVRAYRAAARTIASLSRNVADMVEAGEDLTELPGIGPDLSQKIHEIVETGKLAYLEELGERVPLSLRELLEIPGLGPKHVKTLYEELGIASLEELKQAADAGAIRTLRGFGEKTEQSITEELERQRKREKRIRLDIAEQVARPLVRHLEEVEGVAAVVVAGSFRRRLETVGDLDILVTCSDASRVMERFVNYEDVEDVLSQGETRATVWVRSGFRIDLRAIPQGSYGAALHYFTGSKAHNLALRERGLRHDLKINEYGVFRGEERIAGRTEEEVYQAVGLLYIEPELRENRGEVEAAEQHRLPQLITLGDIRGDLQMHTTASDGDHSLEEMSQAAKGRGYEYIAITDHSKSIRVAGGLDEGRLVEQIEAIDRLNEELEGIVILKSCEVDILEDGSLDLPDAVLKELDLRVCAVHSKFKLSRERQTERILRAMDNPYFNVLAHPTGRLIPTREPYEIDLERVMEAAKERGIHLELNASPQRLDLSDIYCRMARELGLKIAISTDAHRVSELEHMRYGIDQARRGWLEPEDVINTRSLDDLKQLLKRP